MVIDPSVNSDVEVSFMALVDKPAIEKNFMAFKDLKLNFAVTPDQHIVSGPAMVPDTLIYRRDEMGEYNVFFSKETISQIALKFFKKDYHKNLNLFHDPTLTLDNVTIFESFQSDKSRGILPMKGYEDLPDGTWFISAKIEDPKIWDMVTTGAIKGFSVEGIFSYVKKQVQTADEMIYEILNRSEFTNGHLNKTDIMNAVQQAIANFKKTFFEKQEPKKYILKDKRECFISELKVGGTVVINNSPAPAGKLEFLDGSTAIVSDAGTITSTAPKVENLAKDYTLKDGATVLNIDKLEVGGMAMAAGIPAAPGDYELQDGTKVTVGDGGLIIAVTPGANAAPPQFEKQFTEITGKLTAYDQKFAQYDKNQLEFTETLKKTNATILGLVGIVEELAKQPTAVPAAPPHSFSATSKEETKEERVQRMTAHFKKLKSA